MALGSNLGDRARTLESALSALSELPGARLLRRSTLLETAPASPADGDAFLNAAALLETTLPPEALLGALHELERAHGRERDPDRPHGGPRTLDLDLILFGELELQTPGLELPHPRFRARPFVLAPAAEVAPDLRDPVSGHTVAELLARLGSPAPR